MKKTTIRLICVLLLALTAITLLASCDKQASYRDDVKISDISDKLKEKFPTTDGYFSPDSDYLGFYFEGAEDKVEEYIVNRSATSTNINEFGVFRVKSGSAEEMKAICDKYIQTMRERWVAQASYIASEHPKMENAEARVFGNYVVYVMLTAEDKLSAFATVEELLKK